MPPQDNDVMQVDAGVMQIDNNTESLPTAPEFVPQGPPPSLGVVRTLVLALMVLIGVVDLLLFFGVYLAATTPADQLPTGFVQTEDTSSQNTLVS